MHPSNFRGVNSNPIEFRRKGGSLRELDEWGVNLVRLHIIENRWNSVRDGFHAAMMIMVEAASKNPDIKFILNIRRMCRCDYAGYLKEWQWIIPQVDHFPNLIGYDIVNEPLDADSEPGDKSTGFKAWQACLPVIVQSVRGMTDKVISIEAGRGVYGWKTLQPVNDPNLWYSLHTYWPFPFTHQGRIDKAKGEPRSTGHTWPGDYYNRPRDLKDIEKNYQDVFAFFERNPDAKMFIGEAGCSADCDEQSIENWCRDIFGEICEPRGWGYCWHSYPHGGFPSTDAMKPFWAMNAKRRGAAAGNQQEPQSQ